MTFPVAHLWGQNAADSFWVRLQQYCGKSFEGRITAGGREGDGFTGNRLLMQVKACNNDTIRIPFYAGENRSRVWVFARQQMKLMLKHEHRHEDGTPDRITGYGGLATNSGSSRQQVFPADDETCNLLPAACGNIWWITLTENEFTYNLRRIGTDRLFTVSFDITKPVTVDWKPWGWE